MKNKAGIAGKVITAVFLLTELAFLAVLARTKMVPSRLLLVIALVLGVLALVGGILTWTGRGRARFAAGTLGMLLFAVFFAAGGMYIYKTTDTLARISGARTEVSSMAVFVRADDQAKTLMDTKDYTYQVMGGPEKENSEKALEELKSDLGGDLQVQESQGLTEVVDKLVSGEVGAIVLNKAYLPLLEEMEGYEEISSGIRELDAKDIETVIETNTVSRKETEASEDSETDTKNGKVYTVFISGIDNRGGLIAKSRSDVNIIAVANIETRQLLLVSTPRDYFVPLSISNGVPDKLTHAGIYGITVCMDTMGMLYDMDINQFFRVNFDGFINIIDALGGITVHSDYTFGSKNELGYDFTEGDNEVDGAKALVFARERYSFSEGDRQRGRNQMEVIKGVINKALSPELLKNYSSVLKAVQGAFETNIAYEEIAGLLQRQLRDGGMWNVVTYSVNGTGDTQKPYSMSQKAYVMVPDQATVDKAKALIQKVKDGEIITQEETAMEEITGDTAEETQGEAAGGQEAADPA